MAVRANVVLVDGDAVNHTYGPTQDNKPGGFNEWYNRAGGIAAGFERLQMRLTLPPDVAPGKDTANRMVKLEVRLNSPTLESLTTSDGGYVPAPRAAYSCMGKVEMFFPERSTEDQRSDFLAQLASALSQAPVKTAAETFEGVW
jgi:hypothetical protein